MTNFFFRAMILAALIAAGCFDPTYVEGIRCSETGACPPGMVCDPADNRCRTEVEPVCATDSDCATGVCDQSTGMCVAACRPDTCTAGPCQTARCDGDMCVVESLCGSAEMCCAGECVAAGCDDSDPATDDICGESGCEHTPNTGAACDDGMYCNGADTYIDGLCDGHDGDPCAAPLTCDDDIDMCVNCSAGVPCPEPDIGAWSACGGFGGVCDQTGTRSRTVTTYACQNDMCVPTQTIETETCMRSTEGITCGSTMVGPYGACGGFADTCDEGGTQSRDVTAYTCVSEVCTPTTTTESQSCMRSTTGVTCQPTVYGAWGSCTGYMDTCDESGTRARDVTTYACASEACVPSMSTESEACSRDTDGVTCAPDSYGSWGTCGGYSSTCDETGTRSRSVTSYECASESCDGVTGSETGACSRNTDGNSCGTAGCGSWGTCGGYSSTCDETGTQSRACTNPTCVTGSCNSGSYTDTQSCVRDTDGLSCGSNSCGAWGSCNYSDVCDEVATRTRSCSAPTCTTGSCASVPYTESDTCTRNTDGLSCGAVTCGSWSACSGYSSTCDETGIQTRTCSAPECVSGGCVSTSYTETRNCMRDTDNNTCGSTTCGSYGACSYSSECDESGTRTRTCSTPICASGSCSGSMSSTESQTCSRNTDGNICLGGIGTCLNGFCETCFANEPCTSNAQCGGGGICRFNRCLCP